LQHRQCQRRIGSWPNLQEDVGVVRQFRPKRIDDGISAPVPDLVPQQAEHGAFFVGRGRVGAPDQDKLAGLAKIDDRKKTAGVQAAYLPGRMAYVLYRGDIGGTEGMSQSNQHEMFEPLGHALTKNNGSGTMSVPDPIEREGNLVEGFRPGNFFPSPGPSFSGLLQRSFQAIRMIDFFGRSQPFRAHMASAEHAVRIRPDFHDTSVFYANP
jgi:hypothetical protein